MKQNRTYGAGHDFSPKGRKLLWGIFKSTDCLPELPSVIEINKDKCKELLENKSHETLHERPLVFILNPKCRAGQKMIKATGDYKPPYLRMNRVKSCFVTLDHIGNKVSYYRYGPTSINQPHLPSYIKQIEIFNVKIKRCTLHSYLRCNDYRVDKKTCNVCAWFREKERNEDL